jgi:hypothetical protein
MSTKHFKIRHAPLLFGLVHFHSNLSTSRRSFAQSSRTSRSTGTSRSASQSTPDNSHHTLACTTSPSLRDRVALFVKRHTTSFDSLRPTK